MQLPNERIVYLLKCYTERTATSAELEELTRWLADEDNEEPFRQHVQQLIDRYDSETVEHVTWDKLWQQVADRTGINQAATPVIAFPGRKRFSWLNYAAAAFLIIGTSVYFWRAAKPVETPPGVAIIEPASVLPGGNKAQLQLADGTSITLDSAATGMLMTQQGMRIVKDNEERISYSGNSGETPAATTAIAFNVLSTPRGGQYQLVLPDNSKAWLNAESSISFPVAFSSEERLVKVTGEVYFEIAKNEKLPFRVNISDDATIEVLGTHFNVNAYNAKLQTTLLEGSVKLLQHEQSPVTLKPGQQAQVGGGIRIVDDVDLEKVMAWKNGLFNFDGAGVEEVMQQLQRWYDVEVRYEGAPPKREFRGALSRNLDWQEMLQVLTKMKIQYVIKGKQMTIYGNANRITHP